MKRNTKLILLSTSLLTLTIAGGIYLTMDDADGGNANQKERYSKPVGIIPPSPTHNAKEQPFNKENASLDAYRNEIQRLALRERYADGIELSKRLQQSHKSDVTFSDHEQVLRLYANQRQIFIRNGQQQEADKTLDELTTYAMGLKRSTLTPEQIAQVTDMLLYRATPKSAYDYIVDYERDMANSDILFSRFISILLVTGQQDRAYKLAYKRFARDKLGVTLYDDLLRMAYAAGDSALVQELRDKLDLNALQEHEVITLIELAINRDDNMLLQQLRAHITTTANNRSDAYLDLVFAIANGDMSADDEIAKAMRAEPSISRRLHLGFLCAKQGFKQCIDAFHDTLPDVTSIDNTHIISATQLLAQSGRGQDAYQYINAAKTASRDPIFDEIWFPLAAEFGSVEAVTSHLTEHSDIPVHIQRDAFRQAMQQQHDDVAVAIAQSLYATDNTSQHHALLIQSYIRAKRYEQALPLLRDIRTNDTDAEANYVYVLSQLAASNDRYAQELRDYGITALEKGLSPQRKQATIYALAQAQQLDIALPHLKELALQDPQEWGFLYADYLNDTNGKEAAYAFWQAVSSRYPNNKTFQAEVAQHLLQQDQSGTAITILKQLASDEKPNSPIVDQLLYIWGPLYSADALEWLLSRAESSATEQERYRWYHIINNGISDEHLVPFVQQHPTLMESVTIERRYLDILPEYTTPDTAHSLIRQHIAQRIPHSYEVPYLLHYAKIANNYGMYDIEYAAYDKALQIYEDHPEVLSRYGVAAYEHGDHSKTIALLSRYFSLDLPPVLASSRSYRPHFYYAEALRINGRNNDARLYYRKIVAAGSAVEDADTEFHSMAARSLAYSGFEESSMDIFNRLLRALPHDRQLRADYSATLLKLGKIEEAEASLDSWHAPVTPSHDTLSPVKLSSLPVHAFKLIDNGSAILLTHNAHTTLDIPFTQQGYEWLSRSSRGRAETMLSTTKDYRFNIVANDTTNEMWLYPEKKLTIKQARQEAQLTMEHDIIRARIDMAQGKTKDAGKRLQALIQQHPNNPQILALAANIEHVTGNAPYAHKLVSKAHALQPENEDFIALQRAIERDHGANVYLDGEWRSLGSNDEYITTIGGTYDVHDQLKIGIQAQNNAIDSTTTIRLSDGRSGQFDVDRQRGEVFARYTNDMGTQTQLSLFANNDAIGLGAYYQFSHALGQTNFGAELHKPYWEFAHGTIDHATRDRIEMGHQFTPYADIIATGMLAYNVYNTTFDSNTASSVNLHGGVSYHLDNAPLAVSYNVDAEYTLDEENGINSNNNIFRRFPVNSREVHALTLHSDYRFNSQTSATGAIGVGVERISGDTGPIAEGRITHDLNDLVSLEGRASYHFHDSSTDDELSRIGIQLQYKY